jgi:hypothetical protein
MNNEQKFLLCREIIVSALDAESVITRKCFHLASVSVSIKFKIEKEENR